MSVFTIKGRKIIGGYAKGEALVTREGIGTFGLLEETTGIIHERNHEIEGKSIAGKIWVFPFAKGSSYWGVCFHNLRSYGAAPLAMLVISIDSKSALGAIASNIPTMTDFDINPIEVIQTGDLVEVDADREVITVYRCEKE